MVGKTIAHYEVLDEIGAGGMGVVYRARDTRLDRKAAIKALPEGLAEDPERLARFEREAKLLASLKNPHIATLYGLEEAEGRRFLAMELVEGTTLAERLLKGPIPVREALELARQIAEALEAAHEAEVIHRDVKPGNIMIGKDGKAKVLDFGLAKALRTNLPEADLSLSPTLTRSMTQSGQVLGTPVYMSPEQAEGRDAGKQSDIWSFGCVLYEMLSGRRAFPTGIFRGAEVEPDWEALPLAIPVLARSLLRRCLEKDLRRRIHDMSDVRIELEDAQGEPTPAMNGEAPVERSTFRRRMPWILTGVVAIALVTWAGWTWTHGQEIDLEISRFDLRPPTGVEVWEGGPQATLSISPDGRRVAFVGQLAESPGRRQLYLRSLEELDARPLPGTQGAYNPFFSPDGRWLGFVAGDVLQKIPVAGGEPLPVCPSIGLRGASWGEDGTILFSPVKTRELLRVSSDGGDPETVTTLGEGEQHHRWPHFLPGSKTALFSVSSDRRESHRKIGLVSIDTGEHRILRTGGSYPRYARTGHLLFGRLGSLYAVPFDLEKPGGEPRLILEDIYSHYSSGRVAFGLSDTGSLVYFPGAFRAKDRELAWVDRKGNVQAIGKRQPYLGPPVLSPDGKRLAVGIQQTAQEANLWIYEIKRDRWNRLTSEGPEASVNVFLWSPDNRWLIFSSSREGPYKVFRIAADGSGSREQLTSGPQWDHPNGISPDGKVLAIARVSASYPGWDIVTVSLDNGGPEETFLATPSSEWAAAFSPDGRWIAYQSDASGQDEVYVRPYPASDSVVKVSKDGGQFPRWNPDGRELVYSKGRKLFSVPIRTEPELVTGTPQLLFESELDFYHDRGPYLSSDGQFLILRYPEEEGGGGRIASSGRRLVYVPNWTEKLTQKVSGNE